MVKNKIYKYLLSEVIKNFITILLTFTAIAWVVRAVNFLDLIVEDGYSSFIYIKYSLLNITTIITRFVPLSFLLSLVISIVKFEKQRELLILWTSGMAKIKIANVFLFIAFFITLFQLILSIFINPFLLSKSRSLLSDTEGMQYYSVLRTNDFSDTFKSITFYVEEKNEKNELKNIFIKDVGGNLNTLTDQVGNKKNLTIVAKKGFIVNNKLILYDGIIQTLTIKNEFKDIVFEKTELSLINIATRTIKKAKIQETSSNSLIRCLFSQNNNSDLENCSENFKNESIQNLSRRLGAPLYVPLISIIISFLLIYKKEKKFNYLKKYILFILSFLILVSAEILLKYTGLSLMSAGSYFVFPIIISIFFYIYLFKKLMSEQITK